MVVNNNLNMDALYRGMTAARSSASLQKMASGLRINSAADDAAGLAISEKMRSTTTGLAQASQNVQSGVSLIQTAEGGLGNTADILKRMKELAVQASNGTYTDEDRQMLGKEFNELKNGLDQIASSTNYNGMNLLDGSLSGDNALTIQAGARGGSDQTVTVGINSMSSEALGLDKIDISSLNGAMDAIQAIDTAINSVSGTRGGLGASQNRLEYAADTIDTAIYNITASESRIRDLDMAKEAMERTRQNIQNQSSLAVTAHEMNFLRQNATVLLK